MLEKGKINSFEFQVLVIMFTIGSSILVAPSLFASVAKQDAWISSFLSLLISLSFIWLYNHVASLYPSMTFVEYSEKILGKWIGKIASIFYLLYFFYLTSVLVREIGDFLTTQVMVETPIQMIIIIFSFVSLFGVKLGIEVISRTNLIFFPWVIALLFILMLFLFPEIKLTNIQPIFGVGIKPIVLGAYHTLGLPYLELPIFLMIIPFVSEKMKINKSFYLGTIIGGIILSLIITFTIFVLGPDFSERNTYPTYILGKKLSIKGFLERIEVIVAVIWFFTVYIKLTVCFYGLTLGTAQLLKLKTYKILLYPLAFLIIPFSIISHPNTSHFQHFIAMAWTPLSIIICFLLPMLLFIIGTYRKKQPFDSNNAKGV